ncbi:hypothetical protein IMZ48_12645 [Candidatus Bathyarchaeota archaeon]|nr:hypothetical protein [Candidatus Bathyarchaeota archaeon]
MFKLGALEVYNQVLETLGARGASADKQTAIKNAVRFGLHHVWHYHPWTWRRRQFDITVTASTPYQFLPADYESMACSEISRQESTEDVQRSIMPLGDRDWWRFGPDGEASGPPNYYRVTMKQVGSTNWYALQVQPTPDQSYTLPDAEYYCAASTIGFTGSTGTIPAMPTEFFPTWVTASEWAASKALGRHRLGSILKKDMDEALVDAARRHDEMFPDGPPQGLEDTYGDSALLR